MSIVNLTKIAEKEILPGFTVRFVHSDKLTMAFWNIKAGSELPAHHHVQEQVSQVIEGTFELCIDGEKHILTKGLIAIIRSNVVHSAKAITDCVVVDTFCPRRDDYLND